MDVSFCVFFCFKQKTAYEMRISDWSSDVCSSDLPTWIDSTGVGGGTWEVMAAHAVDAIAAGHADVVVLSYGSTTRADLKKRRRTANQIGRASCRERVCQYV